MSQIPTLDIRRFETDRDAFVAELGAAYREWGFLRYSWSRDCSGRH
jgi:isopenicillin N synthase-like dioxygenase